MTLAPSGTVSSSTAFTFCENVSICFGFICSCDAAAPVPIAATISAVTIIPAFFIIISSFHVRVIFDCICIITQFKLVVLLFTLPNITFL